MLWEIITALVVVVDLAYLIMIFSINSGYKKPVIRKLPKVSVIIAARDEPLLEMTLKNLKKIKYPKMEIIVVGSRKDIAIAKKYAKTIVDKGIGKGPALNAAIRKAGYDILYFLDADSMVEKDTIARVCSGLEGHDAAVGVNIPENNENIVTRIARLYFTFLPKIQLGMYNLTGTTIVSGRNFAVRKSTLKSIKFRNKLTEDLDISLRLFVNHKKVNFVNAVSREQVPKKISHYFRQQQRWNRGAGNVLLEWDKRVHHHDIIIMSFLLMIAFMPVLSLISIFMLFLTGNYIFASFLFVAFLLAVSGASMLEKEDIQYLPLTFLAFVIVQTLTIIYSIKGTDVWYRTPKS